MTKERSQGGSMAGLLSLDLEILGVRIESEFGLVNLLRSGLPKAFTKDLEQRTGLTTVEVAQVLQIKKRTLQRWQMSAESGSLMNSFQSSQLWTLGVVWERTVYVFGSDNLGLAWLRAGHTGLQGQTPLNLLETPIGCCVVLRHLERIDSCTYL